jgi:hypothetical protein
MRIPVINSEYQLRAQGSNQVATPAALGIADGLQKFTGVIDAMQKDRMQDMQEQIRADEILAQSKWQNQLFETKKKLTENIDTDPNYHGARDKWQAESEKLISGIDKVKGVDETWKQSVIADLRRDQIQTDFQIGSAIKQRRKSEVASAANLNAEMAQERFLNGEIDQAEFSKALGGAYGSAAGVGAIDGNEATLRIRDKIGGGLQLKAQMMLQNGDIKGAMGIVESAKGIMPAGDYIRMRGTVMAADDAANTYKKAVTDYSQKKKITPAQSDIIFQDMQEKGLNYTEAVKEISMTTGQVPPSVLSQMQSYSSFSPDSLSKSDASTIYSASQAYQEMPSVAKQKFDKKSQVLFNAVALDTAAGIPVEQSVKQRLASLNTLSTLNTNTKNSYMTKALEDVDFTDDFDTAFSMQPEWVSPELVSAYQDRFVMYRATGYEEDKAKTMAKKDIVSNYGVFDGQVMRAAPTEMWGIQEDDIMPLVKDEVSKYQPLVEDGKYTLISDSITAKESSNNLPVTYPIFKITMTSAGVPIRQAVIDDKGMVVRMTEPKVEGIKKPVVGQGSLLKGLIGD